MGQQIKKGQDGWKRCFARRVTWDVSKFDSMLSRLSATKGVSSQETQGDRSVPQIPVRPLKKKKTNITFSPISF